MQLHQLSCQCRELYLPQSALLQVSIKSAIRSGTSLLWLTSIKSRFTNAATASYSVTNSAKDILNMLLSECEKYAVTIEAKD